MEIGGNEDLCLKLEEIRKELIDIQCAMGHLDGSMEHHVSKILKTKQ